MASFKVPAPVREVPAELKPEIDASVRRFEEQWGLMLAYAKANGYIDNYRAEVTIMVMKGYDLGSSKCGA
jgi:hypothetical protein